MVETKSSKFKTFAIISLIILLGLVLLIVVGHFLSLSNSTPTSTVNVNPSPQQTNSDNSFLVSLLWFFIFFLLAVIVVIAYLLWFRASKDLNLEQVLYLIRNFYYKAQDKLLDESVTNLSAKRVADTVFVYFKAENLCFEVDLPTRFIGFRNITIQSAINEANTNTLLRSAILQTGMGSSLVKDLTSKGFDEKDVNKAIENLKEKVVAGA